jgi:hypothetical protein
VGATLEWAPYLRATVAGGVAKVDWALYAGSELRGGVFVQLKILGTPVLDKTFWFPPLRAEWRVAGGTLRPGAPPRPDRSPPGRAA